MWFIFIHMMWFMRTLNNILCWRQNRNFNSYITLLEDCTDSVNARHISTYLKYKSSAIQQSNWDIQLLSFITNYGLREWKNNNMIIYEHETVHGYRWFLFLFFFSCTFFFAMNLWSWTRDSTCDNTHTLYILIYFKCIHSSSNMLSS